MKAPAVYKAIAAITAELARSGIAKNRSNSQEGWLFRGIDDVYNALSPLLAKYKLCIFPRILSREAQRRQHLGESVTHVTLHIAFDFVCSIDGSMHSAELWSEGTDRSDKATNKALSAAYKYAAFQVFCIPIVGQTDPDLETIDTAASPLSQSLLEPVQGWAQWTRDIIDMIGGCESDDAILRLQKTYREELYGLSKYDAAAYGQIGNAVNVKRRLLAQPASEASAPPKIVSTRRPKRNKPAASPSITETFSERQAHATAAA